MSTGKQMILSQAERRELWYKRFLRVLPFCAIGLLIFLWIVASRGEGSQFPSPADVWARLERLLAKPIKKLSLWQHIMASLQRVFAALFAAWTLGIAFGILIGWSKKANALFGPIFTGFRSVPPLAWIPLITIWFGIGEFPKMLVVFIGALMPVVVNTQAGIQNVPQMYVNVGQIFNANKRRLLVSIAVPSALDAIFAGVRTSTSAAWMVVLAAEMLGGESGVGFLITRGMDSGDLSLVLLSMICIGLVGAMLAVITQVIESLLCPWNAKYDIRGFFAHLFERAAK